MEADKIYSKKEIRRITLNLRKAISATHVNNASRAICSVIIMTEYYRKADRIALYMPIKNEVDVTLLFDDAMSKGKRVFLPKVKGAVMDFFYYDRNIPLISGNYDILEPQSEEILEPDCNTLIVMPGAVFSEKCDRIGYGGGYYDRYLSRYPSAKTIAVAYQFQIYPDIPTEETDIRPDFLIGEERIYGNPDRNRRKV